MKTSLADRFATWLTQEGIRVTRRRLQVAEGLERLGGHPTLAQLSVALHGAVSDVTVYRTIRLLEEAGLVDRLEVDGVDHYEVHGRHHDHLVCVDCGEVFEFHSTEIEERQRQLAAELGFAVEGHAHLLYVRCGCKHRLPEA